MISLADSTSPVGTPMLEFVRFDPSACHFPPPAVPVLPGLRLGDLRLLAGPAWPAHGQHFVRGRYALAAAYAAAGVGARGALLAPAYHCRTMLDPALALDGAIRFYPLDGDLGPDLDALAARLQEGGVAALLLTHYFGVPQAPATLEAVQALCRRHGVALVEDCAHAWPVALQRAALCQPGSGHYVVASPSKYFGCADGGMLWGAAPQALAPRGWLQEVRGWRDAWRRGRPSAPPVQAAAQHACGTDVRSRERAPSHQYQPALAASSGLAGSRWIMRHSRLERLAGQRRQHYATWSALVAGLARARPLWPSLPDGCAPYMFPLLLADDSRFAALKRAGLPIWRWDELASSDCAVSARYRRELLHLPCHQGLEADQLEWMGSQLRRVLA